MSLQRKRKTAAFAALLSAVMLFHTTSFSTLGAELTDLNGDGVIDVFDYVLDKQNILTESAPATLQVNCSEGAPGGTAVVTVSVSGLKPCTSASISLDFPEELVPQGLDEQTVNSVPESFIFSELSPTLSYYPQYRKIVYHTSNQENESQENGALFSVTFALPEQAELGTQYPISVVSCDIQDSNGNNQPYLIQKNKITVKKQEEKPTEYSKSLWYGIDISSWQGDVNFQELAKNPKVEFAILRAGYGRYANQVDKKFVQNYNNAKAAKVPVGAYWYSYAMTPDEARAEAKACLEVLGDRTFEYPIAFDIEEPKQLALGIDQVSAIILAFCSEIENAGYYVSVYCSSYFLNNTINQEVKNRFDVWVAHYRVSKPSYRGKYGIWQYGAQSGFNGVSGDVDVDYAYYDYPTIIRKAGLNGF